MTGDRRTKPEAIGHFRLGFQTSENQGGYEISG
jgi:hypothetical protein